MRTYEVTVTFSGRTKVRVQATDEEEASAVAGDSVDIPPGCSCEVEEIVDITEIVTADQEEE